MGASRGIGRGIAASLAREGARVGIASRSREGLEEAAAEIDGEVVAFEADTSDLEPLGGLPGEVESALGPIEILVINTGGPPLGGALDNPQEEWEQAYRSLVLAPRTLVEAVLPGMRAAGWGRIVNVGSTEVAGDGITVNTIATGRFATDRLAANWGSWEEMERRAHEGVPAGRLGLPEEYGDLVAFLCSERAGFLTGAVIPLDGGMLRSV
jgi:3-oxoacyl-[acyl-carrier protein] reductase